ncbi:MAG TPA: noncanonical pyrimidine nucleotidase, YjjG family [Lutibacter sp.]|nr:noncanonical pyrimidine nucleotidase, YjjG family [Lutibacter sp.]
MRIKHIFFDLDHTLWDFEKNSAKAYALCFKENKIDLHLQSFLSTYVPINLDYWKLYREEKVSKEDLKTGRLKDSFQALNYSISNNLIDKIADEYLAHLPKFNTLFDGTIEILTYLKAKYSLHIITNGFGEIQNDKIEKSGIKSFFTELITSDEVGLKKPNPKVFEYALSKANAKTQESIMIGDSMEADIQGAINVGMKAIHFNPDKLLFKKHHKIEINHLNEIKNYL